MNQRTRTIRNLFFLYIQGTEFEGQINAQELALLMAREGMIDLEPHWSQPRIEHYRPARATSRGEVHELISDFLEREENELNEISNARRARSA